ncbi:hypothetical protein GUJ93_ZPchr0009g1158 [Zizania palustris]|uniref:Uncharacterized protein n=1 Tax=Zizania palustris TaxID=103762 RepID=A0A8J5RL26_ZIZPA|nr:hypothetical protein GUJ93_ZPchr0009g1158 [Zizania palustris]
MEGMWRKAKKALGAGLCVHLPAVSGDREDDAPNTPVEAMAEAGRLRRSKSGTKSSKVSLIFLPISFSDQPPCIILSQDLCLDVFPGGKGSLDVKCGADWVSSGIIGWGLGVWCGFGAMWLHR